MDATTLEAPQRRLRLLSYVLAKDLYPPCQV